VWYIDTDNVVSVIGLRNVETGAYVNNATITGILYKSSALRPIADGPAVDKGSGLVGIPCTAHGLASGVVIRIERTINYNAEYLVNAGSTVNEIVVTATYTAEVFTGEEFIYEAIVGTIAAPVSFGYVSASDGDYVGKIVYTSLLLQDESYVLCLKEISGSEQVLAKIVGIAGFQGL